jgi:hypothetical protein
MGEVTDFITNQQDKPKEEGGVQSRGKHDLKKLSERGLELFEELKVFVPKIREDLSREEAVLLTRKFTHIVRNSYDNRAEKRQQTLMKRIEKLQKEYEELEKLK